jgi:hypothetical protein
MEDLMLLFISFYYEGIFPRLITSINPFIIELKFQG